MDKNVEAMPTDFQKMVQEARARALEEVERKRRNIYSAFITEEVRQGKRIPMPADFWQAAGIQSRMSAQKPVNQTIQPPLPSAPSEIGFKEAALILLKRTGRPMTAREIVTIALAEGLLKSAGKTPDASLAGQIYTDVQKRGKESPFLIVGPRTYTLNPTVVATPKARVDSNRSGLGKMSYKQAALFLLEREQRPMTAKQIVATAIAEGLIESNSRTPDATLAGQLYTEMQRLGSKSPIVLVGPRTYALRRWNET